MTINNLTIQAQEALQNAMSLATSHGQQAVEPLHILDAIVTEDDSVGVYLLQKLGVNINALRSVLKQELDRLPKVSGGDPYFSRESSEAIQKAGDFTREFNDKYASVEHLLLGILSEKGTAGRLLKDAGVKEKEMIAAIKELRKGSTIDSQTNEQTFDALGKYAINLNEQARKGKLDPVIGRDEEIRRVLQILSRRTKNNPILVGEPGVGKSTMLLQLCGAISNQHSVLYITGEESVRQVKLRAARLKVPQDNIFLAAENDVDEICGLIEKEKPDLVVIDSIQTMRCMDISSSSGTVSQVKESAARLLAVAKKQEIPMFIVGHVNKDGAIAGPKVMEHIVDTVLYFEGDKMLPYRILRAAKNRYGSTNELGMFDMTGTGLAEIENPSQMLLEGRPLGVSGNCVACTMEGSRPILSEIQALATKTNFPAPRRACSGYDYNRMNLLIAVLEKRAGYFFGNLDVYVNIVGGIALRDTACDLAVCLSMVSSLLDRPVSDKLIAIGEVGLGGEVRSVPNLEQRLHEAERIGFERAVIPKHSLAHLNAADYPGMKLVGAAYIADAINALKNDRL